MGEKPEAQAVSDQEIEQLRQERFRQRVQRVLDVMQEERVDFRGVPHITPEGRIGVRVVPVEMAQYLGQVGRDGTPERQPL